MDGWDDEAQLAELARMLADVDEFLVEPRRERRPGGVYAARGGIGPGDHAALLIDGIGLPRPGCAAAVPDVPFPRLPGPPGRAGATPIAFPACFSFHFSSEEK